MSGLATISKPGLSRRRFWLAMTGFVIALFLIPFSYKVESKLETAVHISGSEAAVVDNELAERFQSPYVHRVVLVIKGLPDPDSKQGGDALNQISNALRSDPGIAGVISRVDWQNDLFLGKNGGTLVIIGLEPRNRSVEAIIPGLRERVEGIKHQLQAQFPLVQMELTGETPLNFDLRRVSAGDVNKAEARVFPVTLGLLLLAFGSLVAALLPLGVGMLAISMTMGGAALLASHIHLSILVQNLATMLGLGLGIDYALLMVSRFREALKEGYDPRAAADITAKQAGRTLLISAATVAIGFAALLTVPISELRSIGVAGLLVAIMSIMLCTLILPWVLGLLGHRINAARIEFPRRWLLKSGIAGSDSNWWRGWAATITSHPWSALLLAGLPLLTLAFQAHRISPGFPPGDWLPEGAESVKALHSLQGMDRAGIVQSLRVLFELPPGISVRSQTGWRGVSLLTRRLAADPRTAEVVSLPTLTEMAESSDALDDMTEATPKSFLRSDAQATLIEVLPAAAVSPGEQIKWVRELRTMDLASATGIPGAVLRVGGIPALNADYDSVVRERLPTVMMEVVAGSFAALLLGLRSLLAAIKAVMLNLLSVGAAFGALVLVFQDGHGCRLLGVGAATESVFPIVPILSFAIVFGLSMDYEVFLVARVLEERRRGRSERLAVIEGIANTAGLITSAAAIMIVVFAAFTLGSFLVIKMLGFTLAFAVLIDATVVRMVIGPALLQLAGDWNWWPLGLYGSPSFRSAERIR